MEAGVNGVLAKPSPRETAREFLLVLPRRWSLLALLFVGPARECYELSRSRLLEDHAAARKLRNRTRLENRWLCFCFGLRTVVVFLQCVWIGLGERGRKLATRAALLLLGEAGLRWLGEAIRSFLWTFLAR
jgi:hypothetical protein